MRKPLLNLIAVGTLALSSCTNPFGGNSFVDVADVSLDWNNKNFDFGSQQIGSSSVKTFIISNSGNIDATDCGSVRLSDNLNFSIVSQTCNGPTLAQGSQCEVVVESRPQSPGEKILTLDRTCQVKSNTISFSNQVKVTAISPTANWSPMDHSFGIIQTGQDAFSKKFVLSNTGTSTIANCGLVNLSNTTDFYIQNDTCGLNNIAPGGSCEVTVVARPISAGIKATTLSRTCESSFTFATTQDQITVEGFDSFLTLYPPSIDFGDVTESTTSTIYPYMQNDTTNNPVSCDVATISDTTNFSLVYDDCGTRGLTQGDGCSLGLVTSSSAARGEHIANIVKSCTFADSSVKTVTIPMRVNIIAAAPIMYVFNNSHDYGNTYVGGSGSDNAFYFYNGGYAAATGCGQPVLSNTTDFSLLSNNCNGADIAAGNTCDVTVRALPSSTGIKTGNLSMTCAVGGTMTATLQQNALPSAPDLVFSPNSTSYGNVNVGGYQVRLMTLRNQGPVDATGCSAPVLSNTTDFEISSDSCFVSDVAANNGYCDIGVRAIPNSSGSKTTTLTRTCTVGGTVVANLDVTGVVATPNLFWGNNTYNFGNVIVGNNSSSTYFYLYNNGTAAATGCTAPVLSNSVDFSIVYESCGTNDLSVSNSCYTQIRANPQSGGIRTAHLSRTCSVGGTVSTTSNMISVAGILNADWQSKFSVTDFGLVKVNGSSSEQSYYFRNTNKSDLTNCTNPTLSNTTDFTISSNGCSSATLGQLSVCEVKVRSNPMSLGTKTTSLSRTCDESGTKNISLSSSVSSSATVLKVSSMFESTCVLLSDGTVKCWGDNTNGKLGDGTTVSKKTPVLVNGITNANDIFVGANHACALLQDSTVKCWGNNWAGQLGDGTTTVRSSPVVVSGLSNVTKLALGTGHTCAITNDQNLKCWGENYYGSLGVGNNTNQTSPTLVSSLSGVLDVSAGGSHTCAVLSDLSVKCWGQGSYGKLGNGAYGDTNTPVSVSSLSNAQKVRLGFNYSCAILSDQSVKCWGLSVNSPYTTATVATAVSGLSGLVQDIVQGPNSRCALMSDTTYQCWGTNYGREIQNTSTTIYASPQSSLHITGALTLGNTHACSLQTDQSVKCWGDNNKGQLGDGLNSYPSIAAIKIANLSNVTNVASGAAHTCVLMNDQTVRCWGDNAYGQLGDGTTVFSISPVIVSGLSNVTKIEAGSSTTCALINGGSVKCWGYNGQGQLGDTTTVNKSTPTLVSGITDATDISTGVSHSCALLSDKTVKCWGNNYNCSIGDGTCSGVVSTPVTLPSLSNVIQIKVGKYNGCAILTDKTVKCWGDGQFYQIGDGSNNARANPTAVTGLTNAEQLAMGDIYHCALITGGTVKCWGQISMHVGNGYYYYLGGGTASTISGLSSIVSLGASLNAMCALASDGTLKCFGNNGFAQFGDASTVISSPTPTINLNTGHVVSVSSSASSYDVCTVNTGGEVYCSGKKAQETEILTYPIQRTVSGL